MFSLGACAALVIACGGRSTDLQPEPGDSGAEGGSDDVDAALRPGVAFMQGSVACCEQGLGQSCCTSEEKELGRCIEFRGCTREGLGIVGKTQCAKCCDGLGTIPLVKLVDGKCVYPPPHEAGALCAACGNGICDAPAGENPCNCPADCGPPP
jgi:hypothetical protein